MKEKMMAFMLILTLVLSLGLTGCGGGEEPEAVGGDENAAGSAALVVTNGVIYTLEGEDWDQNAVQAMAVGEDGIILAVGSDEDVQPYIGEATQVVDLGGKTVFPGFVDSHVHPPGTAFTTLYEIAMFDDFSKKDTLATISEFVAANPDLEIYWGRGYNNGMIDENGEVPNKTWLDQICPDKPMILTSVDGHSRWLNTAALEMLGIDASTPTPTGGNLHRDANGDPTGILTDCKGLVTVAQEYSNEQITKATQYFLEQMNAWGYTSLSSAGSNVEADVFTALEDSGNLSLRVNFCGRMNSYMDDFEQGIADMIALDEQIEAESELVDVTTAKFLLDGVVEGCTAWLSEPYSEEYTESAGLPADYCSEPMWDLDQFDAAVAAAVAAGYQVHVHSVGDAATTHSLDALAAAQEANGKADYRNVLTHLQVVKESDIPRFAELGIIAAAQPFWHCKETDWWEPVDCFVLGEERAEKEYPLNSFYQAGAVITASGDYPVSPVNNPFWAIEAMVTRNLYSEDYYEIDIEDMDDPAYLLNAAERIPVKAAIEAYTINGAYQMMKEDQIGSLASGKLADFIVVDQDVMYAEPLSIDGTQVLATVFAGDVVFGSL